MQRETSMTEHESLALIESMVRKAKNQFSETGYLYLLWGWVVLICSIGQFVMLQFMHTQKHYYIWFVTWIVGVYQVIYLVRKKKSEKVATYTGEILGYVWLSFVVAMFLVAFIIGRKAGAGYFGTLYPVLFVLYGIPTFLSGIVLRFRPLVTGGIGCWVIAAIAPFFPFTYQLLLIAVIMIVAWIVSGYLLQARYKKQINS